VPLDLAERAHAGHARIGRSVSPSSLTREERADTKSSGAKETRRTSRRSVIRDDGWAGRRAAWMGGKAWRSEEEQSARRREEQRACTEGEVHRREEGDPESDDAASPARQPSRHVHRKRPTVSCPLAHSSVLAPTERP
jgi:hypothetical protein